MSYRRADDRHFIGRIHDRLCDAFGEDTVFRDIDSIAPGANFRSVILRTLDEVDVVVAIIGAHWVRERADEPDFVFLELAEALRHGTPVVPVLLEGASMPTPETLPEPLRPLAEIQAITVNGDPSFRRDTTRLVGALREVVAADRRRAAEVAMVAEEAARRRAEEQAERQRVAAELRSEERATRARLAELEAAATRRQIELERARLEAIEARLRAAEAEGVAGAEPAAVVAAATEPVAPTDPPAPDEPGDAPTGAVAASPPGPRRDGRPSSVSALIVLAFVLGAVALSVNRGGDSPFDELSSGRVVDVTVWVLTLAILVPLALGRRPELRRAVLVGVTISTICFEFLLASATFRFGTNGIHESTWFVAKVVESACLVAACLVVRPRVASGALDRARPSAEVRNLLLVPALGCTAVVLAAMRDEWSRVSAYSGGGYVSGGAAAGVWVALAAAPCAALLVLVARRTQGAYVALATVAAMGAVDYLSEVFFVREFSYLEFGRWAAAAVAHAVLAVVTLVVVRRSARPSVLLGEADG